MYELQEMPDPIGLTALDSLTIEDCHKLRALPRGIGELGVLRQLTLRGWQKLQEMPHLISIIKQLTLRSLNELQEMPDAIGLTALLSLTIEWCCQLRALPRGIGELGTLKQLTLRGWQKLQEMPDLTGLTALQHFTLREAATLGRA